MPLSSVFIKRFNPEYSGIRREAAKKFWIKILEFAAEGGGKILELAAEGGLGVRVENRRVEGAVARFEHVIAADRLDGVFQRPFDVVPAFIGADALFGARGEADLEIGEAEFAVDVGDYVAIAAQECLGRAHLGTQRQLALGDAAGGEVVEAVEDLGERARGLAGVQVERGHGRQRHLDQDTERPEPHPRQVEQVGVGGRAQLVELPEPVDQAQPAHPVGDAEVPGAGAVPGIVVPAFGALAVAINS